MNDKVSVIIPCFNQAQFLEETLQSVINQTFTNWECLIIDDGSTDTSKIIAENYCNLDPRFQYVFQTNAGLSSARNTGLKLARGTYIQLLDGDDWLHPQKFELQIQDLKEASISIADYFSFLDGTPNTAAPNRYLTPFVSEKSYVNQIILDWEYRLSIPCHSVLFERNLQCQNAIFFDENLPNHEDWVFWVQLFYQAKKIKNNSKVLAYYRIRQESMSSNYTVMRQGFLQSADILLRYFEARKDPSYRKVVKLKKREILNKNKNTIFKKLKARIKAKILHFYEYVKNN